MKRLSLVLFFVACTPKTAPSPDPTPSVVAPVAPVASAAPKPSAAPADDLAGKPAPEFSLVDLDGKTVRLADFKGKTVVLEWFNPGCPFVKRAHTTGFLKDMASKETANGVVWLGINSAAAGKQGASADENKKGIATFQLSHPILLDADGKVGRTYGATNTPHLFVIDPKGTLVYGGALDDTGGGEPEPGDKVVNYVGLAIEAAKAGKLPAVTKTKAWGCSVKYGTS